MICENGEHLWTASFFRRGALAFWFCSSCGETDRATTGFSELLEDTSGWAKDPSDAAVAGVEPPRSTEKWQLADSSILIEGDPCSVSFMGTDIAGLSDAHEYRLTDSSGNALREYKAAIERASLQENCFILTRFQVIGDKLIKYRIRCCDEDYIDPSSSREASGISILFGLKPVENRT